MKEGAFVQGLNANIDMLYMHNSYAYSDDVTVNVLSQESDISNCDSDSGSDWSFLDDEWWSKFSFLSVCLHNCV